MRALLQRVRRAEVRVGGRVTGAVGAGLLALLGVAAGDTGADADGLADRLLRLRIFDDENGRLNRSVMEVGGDILVVSQFTLYADCRRGNRPGFSAAAAGPRAVELYEAFVARLRAAGRRVATGEFGALMQVELVNDGPVTILLDSADRAAAGRRAAVPGA